VFKVTRGDFQAPNTADIRIYNLADATVNKIENEFTDVAIQAGYEGNYGLIFNGTIKQIRKGKVDQKDSYVDIYRGGRPTEATTTRASPFPFRPGSARDRGRSLYRFHGFARDYGRLQPCL